MAFIVELAAPAVAAGGSGTRCGGGDEETAREDDGPAAVACGDFLWRWQASPSSRGRVQHRPGRASGRPTKHRPIAAPLDPRPPYMASMAAALRDLGVMLT